ncbi:MAG: hypothetical protein JKY52_19880 [Flavobacteriales bacterium]|nr:hypothetical protein [Flavobacteriales bacterium]
MTIDQEQFRRDSVARSLVYTRKMDDVLVWLEDQRDNYKVDMKTRIDREWQAKMMLSSWDRDKTMEYINQQPDPQAWKERMNIHQELRQVRRKKEAQEKIDNPPLSTQFGL